MEKLFLQIINMSITSCYVILFVILIRFLLKKAPKIYSYALWSIVLLRLIIPFSFQSIFSIIPINTNTIPQDIIYTQTPEIHSGITAIDSIVNNSLPGPIVGTSVNPMQIWISLGQTIWILGILALTIYSIISTMKLSKRLQSSKLWRDNIYESNNIDTPFVFGVLRPKIYIPFGIVEAEKSYIIKHEETHIKRLDHIIKFLGFIIVAIHWFNPLVWIAFFLMSKDMELSCDEYVIREMGNSIKKDYSTSLLSLSTGKRIIGGSPLAFGSKNTKSRIKNILNYKKPRFWVSLVGIIIIVVVAVGLLTNPKEEKSDEVVINDSKETSSSGVDINVSEIVEKYALEFIRDNINMFENPEGPWEGFKIVDSKITKLEKMASFHNILSLPIEIWNLEYLLKPDDITKVAMAGGMEEIDGWFTGVTSMGYPILAFLAEDNSMKYLGHFYQNEFGIDTLGKQEVTLREVLELQGLLPNESYPGNHIIIKFLISSGETYQLLLSQPVVQGKKGIWIVERWMDGNGSIQYEFPDTDMNIMDYYKEKQKHFDNGENLFLGDPLESGYNFIKSKLGQIQVKKEDLIIIDPGTIEEFMETPISHYIGYLTKTNFDDLIYIDKVEFLGSRDEERLKELKIDPNALNNGYYIHNPDSYQDALILSEETQYYILNWEDLSDHKKITREEFMRFLDGDNPYNSTENLLFRIYTKDGYVTEVIEQYLP